MIITKSLLFNIYVNMYVSNNVNKFLNTKIQNQQIILFAQILQASNCGQIMHFKRI